MAADASGNIYVADTANCSIRKVTASGVVTTIAGYPGGYGSTDGTGNAALFFYPAGITMDASGNLVLADQYNHIGDFRVRLSCSMCLGSESKAVNFAKSRDLISRTARSHT